jgi:hypothetical protein
LVFKGYGKDNGTSFAPQDPLIGILGERSKKSCQRNEWLNGWARIKLDYS